MESELIIDGGTKARTQKFTDMSDEELRRRCWTFPEARKELVKREMVKAGIQVR